MNCREFVEFLMAYLDEELPEDQQRTLRQHMVDCPSCETYLDTYRETVRMGKSLCDDPEGPLPEGVPERLVEVILAARKSGT